jgi:hypothetical protein
MVLDLGKIAEIAWDLSAIAVQQLMPTAPKRCLTLPTDDGIQAACQIPSRHNDDQVGAFRHIHALEP